MMDTTVAVRAAGQTVSAAHAPPMPPERRSGLQAPTMLLTGHEGEVLCCQFSPDGINLASGGMDRNIYIWRVYGDCENWAMLKGHHNAILELHWSADGSNIYTCSADKTVCIWDAERGVRTKRLTGHQEIVNSCGPSKRGTPMIVSGGDDGTTKIWDLRVRRCVKTYEQMFQALCVSFDANGERVFTGSLDNTVTAHDMRNDKVELTFKGHRDSVTGLDVSHDGFYLLSNAMDSTVNKWDIRPFISANQTSSSSSSSSSSADSTAAARMTPEEVLKMSAQRHLATFVGASHNFEKNLLRVRWSQDDKLAAAGSADRLVVVWDIKQEKVLYRLSGHSGSVNEVCFHPKEPIIASCGSDKKIYLGELG